SASWHTWTRAIGPSADRTDTTRLTGLRVSSVMALILASILALAFSGSISIRAVYLNGQRRSYGTNAMMPIRNHSTSRADGYYRKKKTRTLFLSVLACLFVFAMQARTRAR